MRYVVKEKCISSAEYAKNTVVCIATAFVQV